MEWGCGIAWVQILAYRDGMTHLQLTMMQQNITGIEMKLICNKKLQLSSPTLQADLTI